jgi:hypothetical protein
VRYDSIQMWLGVKGIMQLNVRKEGLFRLSTVGPVQTSASNLNIYGFVKLLISLAASLYHYEGFHTLILSANRNISSY